MPDDGSSSTGEIGPNAVLQFLPVLKHAKGQAFLQEILERAGLSTLPTGDHMISEAYAARLHRALREHDPIAAPVLSTEAGQRTADYILAHRIPPNAQRLFKLLPAKPAAWLLSRAITHHAWTFAGSGRFSARTPWIFEIADNPLVRGEHGTECLCHWNAAVFLGLYKALVSERCHCMETQCVAQNPDHPCRFELSLS